MSEGRRVEAEISFNGKKVDAVLTGHLENVTYEDIAKDASDALDITIENIDMKWIKKAWYPKTGDQMQCTFNFSNWAAENDSWSLECGTFTLDDMGFSGSSRTLQLSGVAMPAASSFSVKKRTKTWNKITIRKIGKTIAKRYKLKYSYSAPKITVASLEQDMEVDMEFMYKLCSKYGLGMKIYNSKLVIFDPGKLEQKSAVLTLKPETFIDDNWTFTDSMDGIYNGARINYKAGGKSSSKTKSIYFGKVKESSDKARTLKVSETANTRADAKYIACAAVNKSNEQATVIKGEVWPDRKIVAGVCIELQGFGKGNGKYFIDKATTNVTPSGTSCSIEAHKCYARLRRV